MIRELWLKRSARGGDAFAAAIFYGEVLDWARERPGCCMVSYEYDYVVLRHGYDVVARPARHGAGNRMTTSAGNGRPRRAQAEGKPAGAARIQGIVPPGLGRRVRS